MKEHMSRIGITGAAFICASFVFRLTIAQPPVLDFSVYDCSVQNIPGTDSVLVTAGYEIWVADSTDSFEVHYRILYGGMPVAYGTKPWKPEAGWWECSRSTPPDCYGWCPGPTTCQERYCRLRERWYCTCWLQGAFHEVMPLPYRGDEVTIIVDDIQAFAECDETNNECTAIYTPPQIPTLTEWGLIIFGIVLLGFITWVFLKRRKVVGVRI